MANPTDEEAPGARPEDCWNYAGPHVAALVDDCCRMLNYATDKGINVEPQDSRNVSIAGKAFARGRWSEQVESDLYTTKSRLAAAIQPVTTETLAANALHDARKSTRFYFRATIAIASVLVPLSMVVFANAKLASSSKALIESNDTLAVTLYNELQDHRNQIDAAKQHLITAANGAPGASGASGASDAAVASTPAASSGAAAYLVKSGKAASVTRIPSCTPLASADGATAINVSAATCASSGTSPTNGVAETGSNADEMVANTPTAIVIKGQLQEFARNNRLLFAQTIWLGRLNLAHYQNVYQSPWMESARTKRENLELRLPILTNPYRTMKQDTSLSEDERNPDHAIDDGLQKLAVYQDIRAMAQDAQRTTDIMWAAITTYVLPVLYALLGSLAFILRDLSEQSVSKTFHPTHGRFVNRVRLVVAVIIGTVIGLFDNFWKDSVASASPLAIAFVAGYAANTFFAFLDKSALGAKLAGKQQ
jgi:hypothetical protein